MNGRVRPKRADIASRSVGLAEIGGSISNIGLSHKMVRGSPKMLDIARDWPILSNNGQRRPESGAVPRSENSSPSLSAIL